MYNWRLENKKDYYSTLCQWWREHGFPVLDYSAVPNRIFVVSGEEDLYAVPVFMTDASWCIIGFPTSNKKVPHTSKQGALEFLLERVETCMKYEGVKIIMTTSAHPKLMRTFRSCGFEEAEKQVNYYTKNI